MQVFKFGGASIKDAAAIHNVSQIIKNYKPQQLVVIISALGKTTNELELVAEAYYQQNTNAIQLLADLKNKHHSICNQLFNNSNHPVHTQINTLCLPIEHRLQQPTQATYSFVYDQIVCLGELLSSAIVSQYLSHTGIETQWLDVRTLIKTDNTYREGQVQWELSSQNIIQKVTPYLNNNKVVVTQGFLGGTHEDHTTTLGREGSDYTAAIFANILNATSQTIWKDVPSILSGDPRLIPTVVKLPTLSYYEAVEMTYYGAQVIHPKTIKPLQNKNIPLHVRSFLQPAEIGTIIQQQTDTNLPPIIVIKQNQLLISISTKDFSFIAEHNLSNIYELFAKYHIKVNLSQNAAISFSACIDNNPSRLTDLLHELNQNYKLLQNNNVEIITLRHYTPEAINEHITGKNILLEQKSRHTLQVVIKK